MKWMIDSRQGSRWRGVELGQSAGRPNYGAIIVRNVKPALDKIDAHRRETAFRHCEHPRLLNDWRVSGSARRVLNGQDGRKADVNQFGR